MKQQPFTSPNRYRFAWTGWLDGAKIGLPGWNVNLQLGPHESGVSVIAAIHIEPAAGETQPVPGVGITNRLLRRLRLPSAGVMRDIRARKAEMRAWARARASDPRPKSKRGRPRVWTKAKYLKLADLYIEREGRLGKRVAAHLRLTPSGLRAAIRRCRKLGYLPPAERERVATWWVE